MNFVNNSQVALRRTKRIPVPGTRPRSRVKATRLWHAYKPIVLYMGMISLLAVGSLGSL